MSAQIFNGYPHANCLNLAQSYGSIISNIGAALVGGPGVVPGASIGRVSTL